ncbi:MAG: hypothetical protein ACKOB4_16265 [Acidobacteriota bacterium]
MKSPSFLSNLFNLLLTPAVPARSLSITDSQLVLLTLRHQRGEFEPRQAGLVQIPPGLLRPGFEQPNITDEARFLDLLRRVADQADVRKMGNLNVALPTGSARSLVIALDSLPSSKSEMAQLTDWKIERASGYPISELQVSRHRLADQNGAPHWLVGVVHQRVIAQYENLFRQLGWRAGLITPQNLGAVAWLLRGDLQEDQLLVSVTSSGFEVIFVRGNEPIMVREVECQPEEVENEFYRLMVYYRDRLVPAGESPNLSRVLTIGTIADQQRFRDLVSAALERSIISLNAGQIGLKLDPGMSLQQVAVAAGLSSMAW